MCVISSHTCAWPRALLDTLVAHIDVNASYFTNAISYLSSLGEASKNQISLVGISAKLFHHSPQCLTDPDKLLLRGGLSERKKRKGTI